MQCIRRTTGPAVARWPGAGHRRCYRGSAETCQQLLSSAACAARSPAHSIDLGWCPETASAGISLAGQVAMNNANMQTARDLGVDVLGMAATFVERLGKGDSPAMWKGRGSRSPRYASASAPCVIANSAGTRHRRASHAAKHCVVVLRDKARPQLGMSAVAVDPAAGDLAP
jgi:hypothetical protein